MWKRGRSSSSRRTFTPSGSPSSPTRRQMSLAFWTPTPPWRYSGSISSVTSRARSSRSLPALRWPPARPPPIDPRLWPAPAPKPHKSEGGGPFVGPAARTDRSRTERRLAEGPRRSGSARQGPGSHPARSEAGEIRGRIDRGRSLAQFEVELRRIDVAGVAGLGDHLPALDLIAALDVEFAVVAISRDEAIGMLDENEVAVTLEAVAGINDDAALRRPDRCAGRHGDVDAVVAASLEPLNDAPARRPAEFGLDACGVGVGAGQRNFGRVRAGLEVAGRRLVDRRVLLRRLARL